MKFIVYLFIPLLLISLYGGCNGNDGGNSGDTEEIVLDNLCFLSTSENPCFETNIGSETRSVDDMTVEEVISEEQSKSDFVGQLEFSEIYRSFRRSYFLPPTREGCSWDDSGLVIKTVTDWENYRHNCFFTDNFFELPDVSFSSKMVLVSLKGGQSFGTEIVAVLEFQDQIVAIISDSLSDVPSSESGRFGSTAVEIPRKNLPVSFIRVEEICNSFDNFSNAECLAVSMVNVCEFMVCGDVGISGSIGFSGHNCTALNCSSFSCEDIAGIFTNFELNEHNFPVGIFEFDRGESEVICGLVVE